MPDHGCEPYNPVVGGTPDRAEVCELDSDQDPADPSQGDTGQFQDRPPNRREKRAAQFGLPGAPRTESGPVAERKEFRWDITLGFAVAAMTLIITLAPPQTKPAMMFWLVATFAMGVYPALHLADWALRFVRWRVVARAFMLICLAVGIFLFGRHVWPRVIDVTPSKLAFVNKGDRYVVNMTRQKKSWVSSGSGSLPSE